MMTTADEFHFDKKQQTWIFPKHGDVGDNTAWVRCWNGCQDGWFDDYAWRQVDGEWERQTNKKESTK